MQLVLKFPKPYRYTIGQRVEQTLLSALEYIFEANALPQPLREAPLLKAQAKCDLGKLLVRFCFEQDLIQSAQYFQLISDLQECAKMLVGWIAYVRSGPSSRQAPPPDRKDSNNRGAGAKIRVGVLRPIPVHIDLTIVRIPVGVDAAGRNARPSCSLAPFCFAQNHPQAAPDHCASENVVATLAQHRLRAFVLRGAMIRVLKDGEPIVA